MLHRCTVEPNHEQFRHFEENWRNSDHKVIHPWTDVYVAVHIQFDLDTDDENGALLFADELIRQVNKCLQGQDHIHTEWKSLSPASMQSQFGMSAKRSQEVHKYLQDPVVGYPKLRFVLKHVTENLKKRQDHIPGFFNIWVTDLEDGLLGYGVFPFGSAQDFGVVVDYRTTHVGSYTRFNLNRTMVHEIGHCFGLFHTFTNPTQALSSDEQVSGSTDQQLLLGDGSAQTTPHSTPTYGNTLDGSIKDSALLNQHGDMVPLVNMMNYVDDRAMLAFTSDQVERMHFFWQTDIKDRLVTEYQEYAGYEDIPEDPVPVVVTKDDASSSTSINEWLVPVVLAIIFLAIIIAIVVLVALSDGKAPEPNQ